MAELVDAYGRPLGRYSRDRSPIIGTKARLTRDEDYFNVGLGAVHAPTGELDWRLKALDETTLSTLQTIDILEILVDASPDLDRALSDMFTYGNTGFTLTTLEDDERAQLVLDESLETMARLHSPLQVKIDNLISSAFIKGALYLETVFSDQGENEFIDIVINDPFRARYEDRQNPDRGQYKQLGELQDGEFVAIESEFVQYLAINSREGKFFGRSMVGSAIFPILFTLGLMKSSRQVVETQAWPFKFVTIDRKALFDSGVDPEEIGDILVETQKRVKEEFDRAQKGTSFVFGREVAVEIIGGMQRTNMDAIEMLERVCERWIVRALKQFPLLFGINDGNALSTNAEQQMEAFATFMDNFQKRIELVMTRAFKHVLEMAGSTATPVFKLKRITTFVEKYRAERTKTKIDAIGVALDLGLISPQEGRMLWRNPESFDTLEELLEPELPPDAVRVSTRPNESNVGQSNNGGESDDGDSGV